MEAIDPAHGCFLCQPAPDLVYATSKSFFAMLGYGPLGEGYSVIATHAHLGSMLDLDRSGATELVTFTARVRERLSHYGPAVITEHGRVAACVAAATARHEPHCLHAHRLVFPGIDHLTLSDISWAEGFAPFPNFVAAHRAFRWPGQYLYAENARGLCRVAPAPQRMPRQYFRSRIANQRGEPQLADWRKASSPSLVTAAQRTLGLIE
jgi:hypothetical protein